MGRWLSAACVLGLGCFSEATSSGDGGATASATTGTMMVCPLGTRGCPCDGLECDVGLACHGPSQMCYEPDCERGALDCPCADGLCLAGLVCVDDFCTPPSADDESTTNATTGVGDPTTTMDPSVGSETTTGIGPSGTTDPGTSSGGGVDDACLACLKQTICTCTMACQTVADCMASNDPGFCCADGPPGHAADWDAFVACGISEGCAGLCSDPPDCGNGG